MAFAKALRYPAQLHREVVALDVQTLTKSARTMAQLGVRGQHTLPGQSSTPPEWIAFRSEFSEEIAVH